MIGAFRILSLMHEIPDIPTVRRHSRASAQAARRSSPSALLLLILLGLQVMTSVSTSDAVFLPGLRKDTTSLSPHRYVRALAESYTGQCFATETTYCQDNPDYHSWKSLPCSAHAELLSTSVGESCFHEWLQETGSFFTESYDEDQIFELVWECPCACNIECYVKEDFDEETGNMTTAAPAPFPTHDTGNFTRVPAEPLNGTESEVDITVTDKFHMKLWHEPGIKWEDRGKHWCWQCVGRKGCSPGDRIVTQPCLPRDSQAWQAVKVGSSHQFRVENVLSGPEYLCMTRMTDENSRSEHRLDICDVDDNRQLFKGFDKNGKFILRPVDTKKDRCVTMHHRPHTRGEYDGETIFDQKCYKAVKSETVYWEAMWLSGNSSVIFEDQDGNSSVIFEDQDGNSSVIFEDEEDEDDYDTVVSDNFEEEGVYDADAQQSTYNVTNMGGTEIFFLSFMLVIVITLLLCGYRIVRARKRNEKSIATTPITKVNVWVT